MTTHAQGQGPDAVDEVEIDFSPLRSNRDEMLGPLSERADAVAAKLGAPRAELELKSLEGGPEDSAAATVRCVRAGSQHVTDHLPGARQLKFHLTLARPRVSDIDVYLHGWMDGCFCCFGFTGSPGGVVVCLEVLDG